MGPAPHVATIAMRPAAGGERDWGPCLPWLAVGHRSQARPWGADGAPQRCQKPLAAPAMLLDAPERAPGRQRASALRRVVAAAARRRACARASVALQLCAAGRRLPALQPRQARACARPSTAAKAAWLRAALCGRAAARGSVPPPAANPAATHRAVGTLCNHARTPPTRSRRDKFAAYRKAGFVKPFHIRRTPYKCRMYSLGGYIVKEYSGCRQKVRTPPPAARRQE